MLPGNTSIEVDFIHQRQKDLQTGRDANDEIIASLEGKTGTDARRPADDEYLSLNRLTLNELHELMREAGLGVRRAELISETVNLPNDISADLPLSDLLTSGVKLLAVPSPV